MKNLVLVQRRFVLPAFFAGLLTMGLVGCGEPVEDSHDHADGHSEAEHADGDHDGHSEHDGHGDGDHPQNVQEAVAKLTKMKDTICKAFADGTPNDAHHELHEVGHILEDLPAMAGKQLSLSEDAMGKLDAAVEALFDGFGELDGVFHGGDESEVDAEAISKELTDAIEQLKQAIQ
ncbi:MAG TPA: hypothetical protein DDW52_08045 [Planctomycetaceae bacterium]|nr:hypothetical protein [Planctomycetaceae bacterium]